MRGTLLQVFISLLLLATPLAQEAEPAASRKIPYQKIQITKSLFADFSMLVQERDEYATNLTRLALTVIHEDPQSEPGVAEARRLLALALHLSMRNRSAVVANHQLSKDILPEQKNADYSTQVFARLLLTRGKILKKQEAASDQFVGECFVEIAAALDPRNEDAVYEFELQKLDGRQVDWTPFYKTPE